MRAEDFIAGFFIALIIGFPIGSCVQSCKSGDEEMARLRGRCEKLGGKISGDVDTPDLYKPCVVNGKEAF